MKTLARCKKTCEGFVHLSKDLKLTLDLFSDFLFCISDAKEHTFLEGKIPAVLFSRLPSLSSNLFHTCCISSSPITLFPGTTFPPLPIFSSVTGDWRVCWIPWVMQLNKCTHRPKLIWCKGSSGVCGQQEQLDNVFKGLQTFQNVWKGYTYRKNISKHWQVF